MSAIPHGNIYKHLKDIRTDGDKSAYEARIPILMLLISTADKRLQTWHSIQSIMNFTGFSKTPVTEALSWFESRGAIYNVPREARLGNAKRIHANRKVWQLTGILQLGEQIINFLYMKDEDRQSSLLEIEDHAPQHVINLFTEKGLLDKKPQIGLQDRPEIGLQNSTQIIEIGLQDRPEIGLQDSIAKELSKENLVKIEELSKGPAQLVEADDTSISQEDMSKIIALIEKGIGMTVTPFMLTFIKEDAPLYSVAEWSTAADVLIERRRKKTISTPYKYLRGILKSKAQEAPKYDAKARGDEIARKETERTILAYEELKRKEAEAIARANAKKEQEANNGSDKRNSA